MTTSANQISAAILLSTNAPDPRLERSTVNSAIPSQTWPDREKWGSKSSRRRAIVSDPKYRIGQPALEFGIVAELLEQLGVVLHHSDDDAPERLVVLDPGVLLVGVLLRVLVGRVRRDLRRNFLGDQFSDAVGVIPGDVAELIVEGLEDVREPIEFRLRLVAPPPPVGTGSISASWSGSWIACAACFSTR